MKFRGELHEVKLSEGGSAPQSVQILRTGTFHHPKHGKMQITPELCETLVRNFNEKVRGIDLMVDYKHDSEDKAAAWFKGVSFDGTRLLADVDWTPAGQKVISDKEFRYLSADFDLKYQSNETLKQHGPTLLGAGLTNRPFIKGMEAITFSEGDSVTELEQAQARIKELEAQNADLAARHVELEAKTKEQEVKLSEHAATEAKREEERQLSEKNAQFDALLKGGRAVEAQREHYLSGDVVKFSEAFVAPKTERVSDPAADADKPVVEGKEAAVAEVRKLAETKIKEGKATSFNAISIVLSENPKLAAEYNK